MFLALDIGNSALKGGLFDASSLERVFSVSAEADDPNEQAAPSRWQRALAPHLRDVSLDRVGLASVVPATAEAVTAALTDRTEAPITRIGPDLPLPFELAYDTPDTLGADRLAAAAGGWIHYGAPTSRSVLVVDAGTAVTCEVIHRDGRYEGGVITAGPALIRQALQSGTAQLPAVPLTLPDAPTGHSTQTALQSGIMWSLVDGVRGLTDRLAGTLPDAPVLILTGGWGPLLSDHLAAVDHHAPHLVLHGIRELATHSAE